MARSLCKRYGAELQPNGSILLVPEDYNTAMDTKPDIQSDTLRILWRMRSSTCCAVTWPSLARPTWPHGCQPASERVGILEGECEMPKAYCNVPEPLALLHEACPVPIPDTMQTGAKRHIWLTIGVDGTNLWN